MGLQIGSHGVHVCVSSSKAETRLRGIVAVVEPHVAPLLVRLILLRFLQRCCLGARMAVQPLLPTASQLGTHLVLPFLCIATPPKCLKLLKFLLQDRGPLGLGNNANGWRFLWPPLPLRLRHCCRLQACWSKGKGGGYEERSHALHRHASRQVQLVFIRL